MFKEFNVSVSDKEGTIIDSFTVGVVDDWENVPEDSNEELEYDNAFDMSEIRNYGKSVFVVPNIEEKVCKILYDHLKDDADKLDDTMHGRN